MFNRSLTPFGAAFTPPIEQSVIFDGAAYLSRTPGSAGDLKNWTVSLWVRRTNFGAQIILFEAGSAGTDIEGLQFTSGDKLYFRQDVSNVPQVILETSAVFRDIGWYHIAVKRTAGTASIWVNGVEQALSTNTQSTGTNSFINSTVPHRIGCRSYTVSSLFQGAIADVHFVNSAVSDIPGTFLDGVTFDGQSLPAPKAVTGLTYGTNGFHLAFADSAAFGDDTSGNGNDWTPTGFVAGDQTGDVPGRPYPVLNAIFPSAVAVTNGGFTHSASTNNRGSIASIPVPSTGQWYAEVTITAIAGGHAMAVGMNTGSVNLTASLGGDPTAYAYYSLNGNKLLLSVSTAYGATFGVGDVIGIKRDMDAGTLEFLKNNVSQGVISSVPSDQRYFWIGQSGGSGLCSADINFGQRAFAYTPPSGFLPLSADNLPTPLYAGQNWFDANPYVGTGATNSITGVGFQRDLGWIKARAGVSTNHNLINVISGDTLHLSSNTTDAEQSNSGNYVSTDADGFTVEGGDGEWNLSTRAYISWSWKAGGAGVANTDGTISSTVSVAAAGHFSIVGYTGTGANATVGHGLPGAPECIIIKNRDQADAWAVYHSGVAADAETDYLVLNTTAAAVDDATYWQDTAPTSSVFSIGTAVVVNTNTEDYIAYCFRSVPGLCKVGSYTGNGSADGPLIELGFTARWIMVKRVDAADGWQIQDTARTPFNDGAGDALYANSSSAESAGNAVHWEVLSSAFKVRSANSFINASGGTYIYLAMADIAGGGDLPWPLAR